jgi:hypothetical protein
MSELSDAELATDALSVQPDCGFMYSFCRGGPPATRGTAGSAGSVKTGGTGTVRHATSASTGLASRVSSASLTSTETACATARRRAVLDARSQPMWCVLLVAA